MFSSLFSRVFILYQLPVCAAGFHTHISTHIHTNVGITMVTVLGLRVRLLPQYMRKTKTIS